MPATPSPEILEDLRIAYLPKPAGNYIYTTIFHSKYLTCLLTAACLPPRILPAATPDSSANYIQINFKDNVNFSSISKSYHQSVIDIKFPNKNQN
jgi:hypothetical protein